MYGIGGDNGVRAKCDAESLRPLPSGILEVMRFRCPTLTSCFSSPFMLGALRWQLVWCRGTDEAEVQGGCDDASRVAVIARKFQECQADTCLVLLIGYSQLQWEQGVAAASETS